MKDIAALIMADEASAESLAPVEDPAAFIAAVQRNARTRDLAAPEGSLFDAARPGLLSLARWSGTAPLAGSAPPPRHWLPIAVAAEAGVVAVDWARFGPEPLRGPVYEADIRRVSRLPFNRAIHYRTALHDLATQAEAMDALAPSGFIFHMSRCGSTLVAQMLAALPDSIAISEAPPLDAVVQLGRHFAEDDAVRALRAIVAAFGRKRAGRERRYVVKLDCWHTLALPLFRRAFPDVPWLFLYRDPVEVLVSQMRQRGMQTVPEYLPPAFYGIDAAESTTQEEYCARVLAAVCRAALNHRGLGGALFLDYRLLPEAVFSAVLPHFGISCSDAEKELMRQTARRDAKSPSLPFVGNAEAKRQAATERLVHAADSHLGEIYERLETLAAAPTCSP